MKSSEFAGKLFWVAVNAYLCWHIGKQYGVYVGWASFIMMQDLATLWYRGKS